MTGLIGERSDGLPSTGVLPDSPHGDLWVWMLKFHQRFNVAVLVFLCHFPEQSIPWGWAPGRLSQVVAGCWRAASPGAVVSRGCSALPAPGGRGVAAVFARCVLSAIRFPSREHRAASRGLFLTGIRIERPARSRGRIQPRARSLGCLKPRCDFQGSCSLVLSFLLYSVLFWGALILEIPRQAGTHLHVPLLT